MPVLRTIRIRSGNVQRGEDIAPIPDYIGYCAYQIVRGLKENGRIRLNGVGRNAMGNMMIALGLASEELAKEGLTFFCEKFETSQRENRNERSEAGSYRHTRVLNCEVQLARKEPETEPDNPETEPAEFTTSE